MKAGVAAPQEAQRREREERRRAAEEHRARVAEAQAARRQTANLFRKRTRLGQPVMKYRIENLLHKITPADELFRH